MSEKNVVYTYGKGKNIKYTAECSCFYECGEAVFWDEIKDKAIKVIVAAPDQAAVIMAGWVSHAPGYVQCRNLNAIQ